MRADANRIGLLAIRSILDAAKPFEIEVAGQKVSCSVARGAADSWPEKGVRGSMPRPMAPTGQRLSRSSASGTRDVAP